MVPESSETAARVTNVRYYRPADPGEAAEFDSFIALLPQLGESHAGEYVAVRGGQVIASGLSLDPVLKLARAALGSEPFFCGWVEPAAGYVFRFGSPTLLTDASPQ
jgi:hypothetical protein